MASASRPASAGEIESESADDFILAGLAPNEDPFDALICAAARHRLCHC